MHSKPTISARAWHHFYGLDEKEERTLLHALTEGGVDTIPYRHDCRCDYGLIFVKQLRPEFYEFLQKASKFGLVKIIAVPLAPIFQGKEVCWNLLHAGAADVVLWREEPSCVAQLAARLERWVSVDLLMGSPLVRENLVGNSPKWKSFLRQAIEVGHFSCASILFTGESGTGKELAACLIHSLDPKRADRRFVVLDCTSIVPELPGSEFFGHERGAFTGAVAKRDGAFSLADGGTLFLDEVGELPLNLQAQLLRVIQEGTYKRVGGNTWERTNFRLICATHRDLKKSVERGRFRHDLYHRIATWVFRLPPLRERCEDILPLAGHFFQQLHPNKKLPELDESVCQYLVKRNYPGNIRELRQLVNRIFDRHVGLGPVTVGSIPEDERFGPDMAPIHWCDEAFCNAIRRAVSMGVGLKEIGRSAEETAVNIVVGEEEGNLQRAAAKLGITDRALQMRRAADRAAGNDPFRN